MTDDEQKLQCYDESIVSVLKLVPLPCDRWVPILVHDLLLDELTNCHAAERHKPCYD